jgi:hypothetical protein
MTGSWRWRTAYLIVGAAFLATVTRYYHPQYGFTAFIEFSESRHSREIPAVNNAPHYDHPRSGGYDGQHYAQLAMTPLLDDPAIDAALDAPPYRARRILFSWIAWAAGAGQPAWILQAAALENVAVWLILAWLLARLIPPTGPRNLVLWSGCLLCSGMLTSVRYALPDGLATLLVAAGVYLAERARPWLAALVLGVAGLARETSVLGAVAFLKYLRTPRSWFRAAGTVLLTVIPLAIWLDYLRAIYRSRTLASGEAIARPLAGFLWKVNEVEGAVSRDGLTAQTRDDLSALVAFIAQAAWLLWLYIRRREASLWALAAGAFLALTFITSRPVWDGVPGAYTRVALPLTIGVNILLARDSSAPWWIVVGANLGIIPGVALMTAFRW